MSGTNLYIEKIRHTISNPSATHSALTDFVVSTLLIVLKSIIYPFYYVTVKITNMQLIPHAN